MKSLDAPNVTYYCRIGLGYWRGTFDLHLTSWRRFLGSRLGVLNRMLALGLLAVFYVIRSAPITSSLMREPDTDGLPVVANLVRIYKLGITLYSLREQYTLAADGKGVHVNANERFGPLPFLFNNRKSHPADILDDGRKAVYYIPLLGAEWTGLYQVSDDEHHIHSTLQCDWAVGHERIVKQDDDNAVASHEV